MLETTSLIHFVEQNKTFIKVLTSNYDISVYPTFYSKRQKHIPTKLFKLLPITFNSQISNHTNDDDSLHV